MEIEIPDPVIKIEVYQMNTTDARAEVSVFGEVVWEKVYDMDDGRDRYDRPFYGSLINVRDTAEYEFAERLKAALS